MTVDQLQQFLAVAKYMSFSKGAEELFLHQSTVSKNIAAMEAELGGALFVRKKNNMTLTKAGQSLYADAPLLIRRFNSLVERTKSIINGISGHLNVLYISPYLTILAPVFARMREKYPNITWNFDRMMYSPSVPVWSLVMGGACDIALLPRWEVPDDQPELVNTSFWCDTMCLVVGNDHPWAERKSISYKELSGTEITITNSVNAIPIERISGQLFADGLNKIKINMLEMNETQDNVRNTEYLMLNVKASKGMTIIPKYYAISAAPDCAYIDIEDYGIPFSLALMWHSKNANPALQHLLAELSGSSEVKSK
ncbi:MAG: LysR family transcriptional regulator [Oscillospiraceae bacterium]|jgi:DNA-binding transcriptional LysR family regulator